jgi:prepilin-type N-terminal cleavage/methylation domain-containing protein/prepilin-type processing-associated H-X9-DG protein
MKRRGRSAFTLIELLVVVAILGVLLALLLTAVQKVRAAADKMFCQNNLKQIGIALHHFHNDYRVLPPSGWTRAGTANPAGRYVGWRALITPYLEQDSIRNRYDFSVHWWEEPNVTLGGTVVKVFWCPSTPDRLWPTTAVPKPPRPALNLAVPLAGTDYEAIMGVQPTVAPFYNGPQNRSAMFRNSEIALEHIFDGTSNTILIVECSARPLVYRGRRPRPDLINDQGIGWVDSEGPFSLDGANHDGSLQGLGPILTPRAINATNDNEPYSFHPGGANFLFADGRVVFINERIPLLTFAALCTRSAGEAVLLED